MKGISQPSCAALVIELMHLRTNAHLLHLKTRSYAAHMALGSFYDELVDLIDSFAEAHQGRYGILNYPDTPFRQESDAIMMLKTTRRYIDDNRMGMTPDSELQNIIDEILALIDSTLYKLEYLS